MGPLVSKIMDVEFLATLNGFVEPKLKMVVLTTRNTFDS